VKQLVKSNQRTISFPVPKTLHNEDGSIMTGKDYFEIMQKVFAAIWTELDATTQRTLMGNYPFEFTVMNMVSEHAFIRS
jgi:hypothetical protein